ncbi:NHL repeat-containing protein [Paenibacillus caui]|uniref:NHL repeat-containing protein n=1 Tax=Paenibacillus caui TaxID=2873927 RepID=UPI001CA9B542|nr:NHL repeat-containing protein [Paenibacillus caui]
MKIKILLAAVLLLPMLAAGTARVNAEASYPAYVYNEWNQSKAAPLSYLPKAIYTGLDAGAGQFNEPQDMFVDNNGLIYIADTGNNRIVKLNGKFQKTGIIEELEMDGQKTKLSGPTGIYADSAGKLYVADKGNGRVLRIGPDGKVDLVIKNPAHPLIPKAFVFKPTKVAADSAGRIYVLSEGQYYGLMQFDTSGQFTGYFGSNKVEVTPAVVLESFWKSVLTKEQRDSMAKLLPIEYSNLDLGRDDFVYTTTIVSQNSSEQIKKLNPLGNNVLKGEQGELRFGDREYTMKQSVKVDTSFVDLAIDGDGFIAALDRTRGHVFEYDQEGNQVAVFGSLGNQKGTFLQPTAVAYRNGEVLVLDTAKLNITVFKLSEYGELVRKATVLYNQGLYEEASQIWKEVSRRNQNSRVANIGIAKALEKDEQYGQAMKQYRMGADHAGYSDTFAEVRIRAVREYLPLVMTLILLLAAVYYAVKLKRFWTIKKRKETKS